MLPRYLVSYLTVYAEIPLLFQISEDAIRDPAGQLLLVRRLYQ